MKDTIEQLQQEALEAISQAQTEDAVEELRVAYVGRKGGKLNEILKGLKDLPDEEKRVVGPAANEARTAVESALDKKLKELKGDSEGIDLTLPGFSQTTGHLHPMTQVLEELAEIFRKMGFMVYEGPEIEHDFYNFESLNIPKSHPARDIQDTFFLKTPITRPEKETLEKDGQWVLRTHTSPMQSRIMEMYEPPLRVVVPGRAFRNEATDATHEHTLYQMEGLYVDKNVTVGQLTWTLREIFRQFFKEDVEVRLRPGYFPFTEPSYEPDMSCTFCHRQSATCKVCKGTGWIEMGGSGMVNPKVFAHAGYPKGKYTGFAFGMGPQRLAMMRYAINDIRMLAENDFRFLEQF